MARGPVVTPEVEILIRTVHKEHPKWKAPRVRNEVESILRKRNPKLPKGWPSLSKIQKILATVRKKEQEVSGEDEPWHTGTLKKYPIPPEALPHVMGFWLNRCKEGRAFTIREAQWVARLYAVCKDWDYEYSDLAVRSYACDEEALEKLGFSPGFLPFNSDRDTALAQIAAGQRMDEETMNNIKKLYKLSDMEQKAHLELGTLLMEGILEKHGSQSEAGGTK